MQNNWHAIFFKHVHSLCNYAMNYPGNWLCLSFYIIYLCEIPIVIKEQLLSFDLVAICKYEQFKQLNFEVYCCILDKLNVNVCSHINISHIYSYMKNCYAKNRINC